MIDVVGVVKAEHLVEAFEARCQCLFLVFVRGLCQRFGRVDHVLVGLHEFIQCASEPLQKAYGPARIRVAGVEGPRGAGMQYGRRRCQVDPDRRESVGASFCRRHWDPPGRPAGLNITQIPTPRTKEWNRSHARVANSLKATWVLIANSHLCSLVNMIRCQSAEKITMSCSSLFSMPEGTEIPVDLEAKRDTFARRSCVPVVRSRWRSAAVSTAPWWPRRLARFGEKCRGGDRGQCQRARASRSRKQCNWPK